MPGLLDAIRHNPLFFAVSLLAGVAGLAVGLSGLATPRRSGGTLLLVGAVAAALGGAALGVGVLGTFALRRTTDAALVSPELSEADRRRLRQAGYAEADHMLKIGLAAGLLPLLLGGAVAARGRR